MLCFPWHILSKNAKKTKLASTLWYNTYKYTAYVEKKKKSENSESVRYSVVYNCLQPHDCSLPGYSVHGIL